jgi:hypothetical protein
MTKRTGNCSVEDLQRLLLTTRADQNELYEIVHKLSRRVLATEALSVALAASNPDKEAVLNALRAWMDLAVDQSIDIELLTKARKDREHVMSLWQPLLVDGRTASMASPPVTYH